MYIYLVKGQICKAEVSAMKPINKSARSLAVRCVRRAPRCFILSWRIFQNIANLRLETGEKKSPSSNKLP